MKGLVNTLRRIPRVLLFLIAGLIQAGLIAYIVYDRAGILRAGKEVMLQTRPVDPRDFLRGDYVVLSYDISALPAGPLQDMPVARRGAALYVKLAPKADGFYEAISVHQEPVAVTGDEVLIKGRTVYGDTCGSGSRSFCDRLTLNYGIEKYFVPEGEGREIESARNEGKVAVVIAVTSNGRAAIKRLLMDGKPVYAEPLY